MWVVSLEGPFKKKQRMCPSEVTDLDTAHVSIHLCCKLKFLRIQCARQQLHCSLIYARHEACASAERKIKTMSEAGEKLVSGSIAATYLPFDSKATTSRDRRGHNGSFPEFSEAHTPAASLFLLSHSPLPLSLRQLFFNPLLTLLVQTLP